MDDFEIDELGGTLRGLSEALTELTDPSTTQLAQMEAQKFLDDYHLPDPSEEELYERFSEQGTRAKDILKAARERIAARKFDKRQLWLAAAQGLGSPTKTGAFSESIANLAAQLQPVRAEQSEFNRERDDAVTDIDMAINSADDRELSARLQSLLKNRQIRADLAKEALKTLGKRTTNQGKGLAAVDREYAKDYVEFIQDGAAKGAKAIEELEGALASLQSGKDNLTGPIVGTLGSLPLIGKAAQDIFNPEASDVQEIVEYTVQESLRPILGAQFTEKEGERLIARVYNRRLDEATNAARVDRLVTQLRRAYAEKQRAAEYFEQHGTLQGFKGKTSWTVDDFMPDHTWPGGASYRNESTTDDGGEIVDVGFEEEEFEEPPPSAPQRVRTLDEARKKRGIRNPLKWRFAQGGPTGQGPRPDQRIVWINDEPILVPAQMSDEEAIELYNQEEPSIGAGLAESALGAGLGYGTGRMAGAVGLKAFDLLPGRRPNKGEKRVLDVMDWMNITPQDTAAKLRDLHRRRVPANLMDVAGPEVRALGEASLLPRASETAPTIDELKGRQKDTRNRVVEQLNQALKPDEYQALRKQLEQDRFTRSNPLYKGAFQQFPDVNSKVINEVINTKEGSRAVRKAVEHWKAEYGKKPFGKPDATGMARSYNLEFLDLVKKYFDDEVDAIMTKGRKQYANLVKRNRDRLRDELDTLTGGDQSPYKAARNQWEADSSLMEALEFGHDQYLKVSPEEARAYVKGLDFTGRDVLRSGVAEALMRQLQGPYTDTNAAQKLVNSPDTMERLAALFDNPKHFEILKEALEAERDLFDETRGTLNKGKASRGTYEPPDPALRRFAREKVPAIGVFSPTFWALRQLRRASNITDKEADQILRVLRTRDPKYIEENLGKKFRQKETRSRRGKKAGLIGAAAGAVAPWLMRNEAEDEEFEPEGDEEIEITEEDRKVVFPGWSDEKIRDYKRNERPAMAKGGRVPDRKDHFKDIIARLKEINAESRELRRKHYADYPDARERETEAMQEKFQDDPKITVGRFGLKDRLKKLKRSTP